MEPFPLQVEHVTVQFIVETFRLFGHFLLLLLVVFIECVCVRTKSLSSFKRIVLKALLMVRHPPLYETYLRCYDCVSVTIVFLFFVVVVVAFVTIIFYSDFFIAIFYSDRFYSDFFFSH